MSVFVRDNKCVTCRGPAASTKSRNVLLFVTCIGKKESISLRKIHMNFDDFFFSSSLSLAHAYCYYCLLLLKTNSIKVWAELQELGECNVYLLFALNLFLLVHTSHTHSMYC